MVTIYGDKNIVIVLVLIQIFLVIIFVWNLMSVIVYCVSF
jgi:hypothetical protein